jgi:hypothetical protein
VCGLVVGLRFLEDLGGEGIVVGSNVMVVDWCVVASLSDVDVGLDGLCAGAVLRLCDAACVRLRGGMGAMVVVVCRVVFVELFVGDERLGDAKVYVGLSSAVLLAPSRACDKRGE